MKRYIVTARKLAPQDRDVFRRHAVSYADIDGGEDSGEFGIGDEVVYTVQLDAAGAEAFRRASNLLALEEDVEDEALALPHGVEDSVLAYHKLFKCGQEGHFGQGTVVAVGDSGLELSKTGGHFDGRLDAFWTWYGDDGHDAVGHGTWCAGAAVPTGAHLVMGKVLGDNGSGPRSYIVGFIRKAARYIKAQGKPGVISLSLGGPGYSASYERAIRYALDRGVVTVCAAGNTGNGTPVNAPANSPTAIAVGAVDHRTGKLAPFTATAGRIDILAAGVNILGFTGRMSGTSMATPLVARAASAALSANANAGQVRRALMQRTDNSPLPAKILDAFAVLKAVERGKGGDRPKPKLKPKPNPRCRSGPGVY